jgi:hypothetical protein
MACQNANYMTGVELQAPMIIVQVVKHDSLVAGGRYDFIAPIPSSCRLYWPALRRTDAHCYSLHQSLGADAISHAVLTSVEVVSSAPPDPVLPVLSVLPCGW